MNFGIKLQMLRKEKRMSQEALAQQIGVSRQAVSKWETGEGYPEIDTLIMISNLFGVSLDYLMKENEGEADSELEIGEDSVILTGAELEDFMNFKRKMGVGIGLSVAAIIASLSIMVFFDNNNLAYGAFLLIVALSVGAIIILGLMGDKYNVYDKKQIILKNSDLERVKQEQKEYNTKFSISIALGVCLIIVACALEAMFEKQVPEMTGYFLWIVAFSVFLFIESGIKHGIYNQICNNKEYIKELRDNDGDGRYFAAVMPLAAMGYLVLGFVFNAWHPGWIIFPVSAILTHAFITLKK